MPSVPNEQGKGLWRIPGLYVKIRFFDHKHKVFRGVGGLAGPVKAVQFVFELDGYVKLRGFDGLYKLKRRSYDPTALAMLAKGIDHDKPLIRAVREQLGSQR